MIRLVKNSARRFSISVIALCAVTILAGAASATTFTGTVHNGTTNKPAANVDVVLLSLQNDMQSVANTKTDAQGKYQLTYSSTGPMPLLVRAIYKGVFFHAVMPPGTTTADVQIYEPSSNPNTVQFTSHLIAFQPNGSVLLVGEEYIVENQSTPPVAYAKTEGNFEFQVPDGADKVQALAQGPEHMPTTQGLIDRGKNRYAISYAFRPGESGVRLSYELLYAGDKATVHLSPAYPATTIMLLAPPTVTVSAAGFKAAGNEQGLTVYTAEGTNGASSFDVTLSGTAPPPSSGDAQGQADPSTQPRDAGAAPVAAVAPRTAPYQWILLAGFGSIFLLGAAFLFRKPAPVTAPIAVAPQSAQPSAAAFQGAAASPAQTFSGAAGTQSLGEVNREVGASLDQLKDTLFRLELRHQAGTISEQEYIEQRARAEKTIRDLVKG
jgi:hypothetical protein